MYNWIQFIFLIALQAFKVEHHFKVKLKSCFKTLKEICEANVKVLHQISLVHIHKVTVLCISFHTVIACEELELMLEKVNTNMLFT